MQIQILQNPLELGRVAGMEAARLIRESIEAKGFVNIILATGTSQFETLNQMISDNNIDWTKIVMFHLDEYIDLPITHPASFRKYLQERFLARVPPIKAAYLINGETNAEAECERLNHLISNHPIDLALVGIGENSHLAFNDPPADFETEQPYIIVSLDESCRKQQLGEGWFQSMDEVPRRAISMSIKQIMKSKHIICSVPDSRKAMAIKNCFEQPVSNLFPASILQLHTDCTCYLDNASAELISGNMLA